MYSVVILTLNEEAALPKCLSSIKSCDDIVVIDSGSADKTAEIAKTAGARVFFRAFDNFGNQRNYAQRQVSFKHPWVFHLDADERMTPELDAECRSLVNSRDLDGYRVAPMMFFEGRWVRHCTDFPAYQARFVRTPEFEFIQVGHGQRESPAMRLGTLRSSYIHDMSIYGVDSWLAKHRRYARDEAEELLRKGTRPASLSGVFSKSKIERRRALKRLSFILPFRPVMRFLYQYVLRMGFLDGKPGLRYCLLLSRYEGFVSLEVAERRKTAPA